MDAIITTATVLAMYFNAATSNRGSYCYNADIENNAVKNIEVFSCNGKSLSQKLQYRFTYDDRNRLASREALKWSAKRQRWENYYTLDYTYKADGYVLERRDWNARGNAYGVATARMEYQMISGDVMAVNYYKMSKASREMELTGNVLVMNPQSDILAMAEGMK